MLRLASLLLCTGLAPALLCAGEAPRLGEQDLRRAHLQAEEGDLHAAVVAWFTILRHADNQDLRSEAREQLERVGFAGQEIFQFDPAALKADDWDKLLTRLSAAAALRQRQELDLEYAKGLLQAAISVRADSAGAMKVDVQSKDLLRALDLFLQLALSEGGGESVRQAQSDLERLGVAGTQVAALRKAAAEGKLPPEIQNELVCSVGLNRLHKYREWLEDREEQEEHLVRKQLARKLGVNVYKYLAAQFAQTAAYKRPSDDLDFWRDLANAGVDKTF